MLSGAAARRGAEGCSGRGAGAEEISGALGFGEEAPGVAAKGREGRQHGVAAVGAAGDVPPFGDEHLRTRVVQSGDQDAPAHSRPRPWRLRLALPVPVSHVALSPFGMAEGGHLPCVPTPLPAVPVLLT